MSDAQLTDCPECETPNLQRLISAAAFRLKGAGWYETDFKSDNKRNLADGDNGAEKPPKDSNGAGDKSADAKPSKSSDGASASSGGDGGKKKEAVKSDSKKTSSGSQKADAA
jgi:hypothetical protein